MFESLLGGFELFFSSLALALTFTGILIGLLVGALPGLGPLMGNYLAGATVDYYTVSPTEHDWRSIFWVPAIVGLVTTLWFALVFRPKN